MLQKKIMTQFIILAILIVSRNAFAENIHAYFSPSIEKNEFYEYKLTYKSGFYVQNKNNIKFLMKFYKKGNVFIADDDEELHVYFNCTQGPVSEGWPINSKTRVFFVRVQMRAIYGFMSVEKVLLKKKGDIIHFSGELISEHLYPSQRSNSMLSLKLNQLSLRQVSSIKDLYEKEDNEYFRLKLKEYFREW